MDAACDICGNPTSWERGTGYTADEFRDVVARGYELDGIGLFKHANARHISVADAPRAWKDSVARSRTGWLLCPFCALPAARYLPKSPGAQSREVVKPPIATREWLALMDLATLPGGKALVLDKYLSGPGQAYHVVLVCPSCGGQTISAGGPSGSMTPLRAAYRSDASFLVCPSCGDDWLMRHLTGRYEIAPSDHLSRGGGADLKLDPRAKALYKAAERGDLPGVQSLLDAGAPANGIVEEPYARTSYPLHGAIEHPEVAKALIAAGADVNARGPVMGEPVVLFSAAAKGHPEVVRLLLRAGASVHQEHPSLPGYTPLVMAARAEQGDRSEVIRLLLAAGEDARTAIGAAVRSGRLEHVRLLLDAGADVTSHGLLHLAAAQEHAVPLLGLLLEAGADVNDRLPPERPYDLPLAIHAAAKNKVEEPDAIRLLLAAGSEIDVPDQNGMTPLHWAALRGHEETVGILLEAGADPNIRTTAQGNTWDSGLVAVACERGWAPADCAKHGGGQGHPELAKKLRARERHGMFGLRRFG
jgi:ankyrin repeat protein/predicted RNA-binding Zn-ribbon protein involved in translation (DUF1610 family)